jgi:hypothetical protein
VWRNVVKGSLTLLCGTLVVLFLPKLLERKRSPSFSEEAEVRSDRSARLVARLARSQKVCDQGTPFECNNVGVMFAEGKGTAVNEAKARVYFERACDKGWMAGCLNLAQALDFGVGGTPDHPRAIAIYNKACKGGDADACHHVVHEGAIRTFDAAREAPR